MFADVGEGIVPVGSGFFVGVEDALGVHDVLGLLEKPEHVFAVHHLQPRTAHQAVIVFAGQGAVIFENQIVDGFHGRQNFFTVLGVFELHERNNVEVTITHVPGDGCEQLVFLDDLLELRQKFHEVYGRDYKVIYIRCSMLVFDLRA